MSSRKMIYEIAFLVFCIFLMHTIPGWGSGFSLNQQGTAAMAQGNAFVAEADDASAIFYNPAGITRFKTPTVYQGIFLNYPTREFSGGGNDSQTNHRLYYDTSVYVVIPAHNRVSLGMGFFSPFGLGSAWPPTWPGRYITTWSRLTTYNLNPVLSVKVLDNLSLAAGMDIMWSRVRLQRKSPVVFAGKAFPDAEVKLTGEGSGLGYNMGILYEPIAGVRLGAAYRSPVHITHSGELSTMLPSPLPTSTTGGSAALTYPPSLTFGGSYSRFKPFTFEFDTTWTGWSTYHEQLVMLDFRIPVNGLMTNAVITPKNWHDAWAFRFGANYEIKPGMKVRAGYIYDLTPVPDSTFDPQVPDSNRHVFTVGGDIKVFTRFTLGIAYNYVLSEPRTKSNFITFNGVPVPLQANGRYHTDTHSLAVSWQFQF